MSKKSFLLLNKLNNTLISEFESNSDFPKEQIEDSILHYWNELEVKKVIINPYKHDLALMTDGKVILSKGTVVEFCLINTSGNDI